MPSWRISETNYKPIAANDGIDVEITPYDIWALHLVLHDVTLGTYVNSGPSSILHDRL